MSTGLPPGWTIRSSRTHNREYFLNQLTKESSWEPPFGTDQVKLNEYLANLKANSSPTQVRCNHLLIKHNGVRRPRSWKEEQITRTRDEAIQILRGWEQKILNGEVRLSEVAQTESDCSSHNQGGDLGFFQKDQMQPTFEKAAFALHVGEVSPIVESDSGVHLIERTA